MATSELDTTPVEWKVVRENLVQLHCEDVSWEQANNNLFNVYTYSDHPYILIFNFVILYNTHIYVRVTLSQRAVSETDRVPFILTILLALHLH